MVSFFILSQSLELSHPAYPLFCVFCGYEFLTDDAGEFAFADFEYHAGGGSDDGFDVSDGFVVELYPALLDEAAGFAG
jgi:hypothetical protein